MSLVHTGKLLIRFIKDFKAVIMEPKIPPIYPKNNFHNWQGPIANNDKKLKVKLPPLPKIPNNAVKIKLGPCEVKEDEATRKREKEKTQSPIQIYWKKTYPHEFAESEEKETTPEWGSITSEDTNFDASEKDTIFEKKKFPNYTTYSSQYNEKK